MQEELTNQGTNSNFWQQTQGPIWALAPMEDVTDTVFREVVLNLSSKDNVHVLFSEFLSTDGFCHPLGRTKVLHRFNRITSYNVCYTKLLRILATRSK